MIKRLVNEGQFESFAPNKGGGILIKALEISDATYTDLFVITQVFSCSYRQISVSCV